MTAAKTDPYGIVFKKYDDYKKYEKYDQGFDGITIKDASPEQEWRRKDVKLLLKRFIVLSNGHTSEGFIQFMTVVNDILVQDFDGCPVSDYLSRQDVLSHLHGVLNDLEAGKEPTVNRQEMIEQVEDVIGEFE